MNDNDSIGAPATGKNVLTVGASENGKLQSPCDASLTYLPQTAKEQATFNNRSCRDVGGQNIIPTWGDWWPDRYPAEPIKSDSQTGNPQQVTAFSSRGPTDDGRIKPDVVAPGSWILSGYSERFQQQLTYAAAGLPAGLTIGAANGLISGTPTTAGTSNVTITVTDGRGGSGTAAFMWTITTTSQPTQLLANPGFESGNTGWSGSTSGVITNTTSRPTHGGTWWASFGGNGRTSTENLYQQVTIPASVPGGSQLLRHRAGHPRHAVEPEQGHVVRPEDV
ncbi:putative Ig domain-containing protein [Actinokineospora sp. HUAS TT18]|uniref:Ig domain-containing protein n=1 Tax=Actinokineospora sp. HUAS TT18 TaxID=3447451 RepID=UPI003F524B4A